MGLLFGGVMWLIWMAVMVVMIVSWWKIFVKAGKPGWAAIVPLLNTLELLDIAGKPWWYLLLMMIPIVNIVMLFLISINVAQAFGKSSGFGIGLAILPFILYPMLAFGKDQYQRPADWPPMWLNF